MNMKIRSKQWRMVPFFFFLSVLLVVVSCDKGSKVRKYKEKKEAAPVNVQKETPGHSQGHFQWDTPDGWQEEQKASGFRLASFTVTEKDKKSVCTIIPLRGEAGGLKANVTRWLGQITADTAPFGDSDAVVDKLLKTQEKFLTGGQFPAVFIDFTTVTPNEADASILATVITVGGSTVFIKMRGEKSLLIKNRKKFKALCESLRLTSTPK